MYNLLSSLWVHVVCSDRVLVPRAPSAITLYFLPSQFLVAPARDKSQRPLDPLVS